MLDSLFRTSEYRRGLVETYVIVVLWIIIIFSVVNIVLYSVKDRYCNIRGDIGIDMAEYFLGSGIAGIALVILLCFFMYVNMSRMGMVTYLIFTSILILFYIVWIIVGGIVLFKDNSECIDSSNPVAIYAVFFWVLTVVALILDAAWKYYLLKNSDIYKVVSDRLK